MYACESYLNLGHVPHSMSMGIQIAISSQHLIWWRAGINRWYNPNWEMPRVVRYLCPLSQLMWCFHFKRGILQITLQSFFRTVCADKYLELASILNIFFFLFTFSLHVVNFFWKIFIQRTRFLFVNGRSINGNS